MQASLEIDRRLYDSLFSGKLGALLIINQLISTLSSCEKQFSLTLAGELPMAQLIELTMGGNGGTLPSMFYVPPVKP